ncbi:MAG: matrixin family metalloprotease [Gemmatimonadetes bacterium]|nr:matrixin family metalloprotease [Gemmatimonadota bacterium]
MRRILSVTVLLVVVLTALKLSGRGAGRASLPPRVDAADREARSAGLLRSDSVLRARESTLRRIAESDTYLPAMLAQSDSVLKRWPDRIANPLLVYLPEGSAPGYTAELGQAARKAFSRWERVAGIPVVFAFTRDSGRADVIVRWIPEFPLERTGQADVRWNRAGWLLSGTLTLATRNPGGIPLPPDAVYTVALHEIGHLLGLGHSDDSADVMYPTTDPRDDLSPRDRRTARLLYELPPGSLRS